MKRRSVLLLPLVLACLLAGGAANVAPAPSLTLATDGRSEYRLCLPPHASGQVTAAADTLVKYIREVSGATIPLSEGGAAEGPRIVFEIGGTEDPSAGIAGLGDDGFAIRSEGDDLFLAAETPYGLQNAVYTFLETYLGCRLYCPAVRLIPRRSTLTLPAINDRQVPVIAFRMLNVRDSGFTTWHKLNRNDDFGLFVHTFRLLVPPDRYFPDHPEYFSLLKGNRTASGQLCLSNPEVFRIVCEKLRALMNEKPGARFWSVSQNDTYVPCECSACRAIDSAEGSPSGSILAFVNRVADEFPDMTISTLAYQYSRSAPARLKPRPNVNIMLCSIECNRSRPLAEDPSSASFVKDVADWSRLTHNIFLWDYVINFRNLVSPFPNLRVLQPNIRFFVQHGITSVFEQGLSGFHGEFAELRSYLIAKLLWNPDIDVDSVMDDFLQGFYGEAAPYIRQYIDTMHAAMEASGEGLDIYGYPVRSADGYLSAAMLDLYGRLFDQAEAAVQGEPAVLARVRTARLPVQFAVLEQAKVAAAGERGCFVRAADGSLSVRPTIDSLLAAFVQGCREAGIPALWEYGTTPDKYGAATRAFLESGTTTHLARGKAVRLGRPASPKYHDGDRAALTDGLKAWDDYHMHWLGFEGEDMDATVDLGTVRTISRISTSFLQDINSWVFMPESVTFSVSTDGRDYRLVGTVRDTVPADRGGKVVAPFNVAFAATNARFVRVYASSLKTCPTWHKGSGGPAWIFIDEIAVE
ncbi:MAG TPA: DUF4838 domain-containing protein [candidate division Zixibacteria bacterium]|nr:DUF4838 domain-containing protein [candidate division Zixibacteria bacterium]